MVVVEIVSRKSNLQDHLIIQGKLTLNILNRDPLIAIQIHPNPAALRRAKRSH
jgi:hypothetical protein